MPRRTRNDNWDFGGRPGPAEGESGERKPRKRRLATTLVFTTVFFAGASLAAVAGNRLASIPESDSASALESDATQADATPAADQTAAPEADPSTAAADAAASSDTSAAQPDASAADSSVADSTAAAPDAVSPDQSTAPTDQASASGSDAVTPRAPAATPRQNVVRRARLRTARLQKVLLPKIKPAPQPEIEGPVGAATIWLNSPLPDPTPPALRLSPKFAANLKVAARASGVNWAVMLGILRARGANGHSPADRGTLRKLADRLGSFGPTKGVTRHHETL